MRGPVGLIPPCVVGPAVAAGVSVMQCVAPAPAPLNQSFRAGGEEEEEEESEDELEGERKPTKRGYTKAGLGPEVRAANSSSRLLLRPALRVR